MNKKKLSGLALIVAGVVTTLGSIVTMVHSNNKIYELERQGYTKEDVEYQEMKKLNQHGGAAALAGLALTSIGIPLALSRKKRYMCEVNFDQNRVA